MKKLTIFTPTFNRAHLLPRLYESLKNQSCKSFIWLVIDDGSKDGTGALVGKWQKEGFVPIQYIFQENQGMSGAHNTAYKNIQTPFNTCIDSDDQLANDAVAIIYSEIEDIEKRDDIAGIIGLDADFDGKILGDRFPDDLKYTTLNDFYKKYHLKGDKKLVYKTQVMQSIEEYPLFKNEKLVPLSHKYLLADQHFQLKTVNKILCLVEYQEDGSTKNMLKQYRRHPRGFAYARIARINLESSFKDKFQNAMHLVSSSFFTGDFASWFKTRYTMLVLSAVPAGILLNLYVRLKTQKNP
ncbi:glycosyltransferase family 2 protein [Chryseobacterium sp. R2A-55]|uniref:glycosyltransferase family 2 protein n=1 Tax=Chryseobacterium sp. R2A-55 TaxID=2744445 RepID=UPI001F360215|nr:glycosyltransferase [Chryseobacterium sp. R2A-55]